MADLLRGAAQPKPKGPKPSVNTKKIVEEAVAMNSLATASST